MVARTGAQRMLQRALEDEVQTFLGRDRYAPGCRDTGYRNGHGRAREIGIGTWSVEVRPPRISDLPPGVEPFSSGLLPGRRYLSQDTQRLFARLYLEGLSSGDFEPAFRELLGEKATLSGSTILRLAPRSVSISARRGSVCSRPGGWLCSNKDVLVIFESMTRKSASVTSTFRSRSGVRGCIRCAS